MDLKLINSLLANLEYPDRTVLKLVKEEPISTPIHPDGEGSQGESNTFYRVYESVKEPGTFIKILYHTDSYGSGSYITGAQFVTPVQKMVTVYEQF